MNADGVTMSRTEHESRVVGYVDRLGYTLCPGCADDAVGHLEPIRWDSGDGGPCDRCTTPVVCRGRSLP